MDDIEELPNAGTTLTLNKVHKSQMKCVPPASVREAAHIAARSPDFVSFSPGCSGAAACVDL